MTRKERQDLIRQKTSKIKARQCREQAEKVFNDKNLSFAERYYGRAILETWAQHYTVMSVPFGAKWVGSPIQGKLHVSEP